MICGGKYLVLHGCNKATGTQSSSETKEERHSRPLGRSRVWQSTEEGIERTTLEYYTFIFTSDRPTQFIAVEHVLEPKVTGEMNMVLTREFQLDEVWRALQQMHPMKSPGPDDMPPVFYQKF